MAHFEFALFLQARLEPAGVHRGPEGDAQAREQRHAQLRPELTLRGAIELRDLGLLANERGAIQRLHISRDADHELALRYDAAVEEGTRLFGAVAALADEHRFHVHPQSRDLAAQPLDAFVLGGRVEDRDVLTQRAIDLAERLDDLSLRSRNGLRTRIEQRVANRQRAE